MGVIVAVTVAVTLGLVMAMAVTAPVLSTMPVVRVRMALRIVRSISTGGWRILQHVRKDRISNHLIDELGIPARVSAASTRSGMAYRLIPSSTASSLSRKPSCSYIVLDSFGSDRNAIRLA